MICDSESARASNALKNFCNVKVMEENTTCTNKAELYVGIFKEALRKDMNISDCPIVFWLHCAERRPRIMNITDRIVSFFKGKNPKQH